MILNILFFFSNFLEKKNFYYYIIIFIDAQISILYLSWHYFITSTVWQHWYSCCIVFECYCYNISTLFTTAFRLQNLSKGLGSRHIFHVLPAHVSCPTDLSTYIFLIIIVFYFPLIFVIVLFGTFHLTFMLVKSVDATYSNTTCEGSPNFGYILVNML